MERCECIATTTGNRCKKNVSELGSTKCVQHLKGCGPEELYDSKHFVETRRTNLQIEELYDKYRSQNLYKQLQSKRNAIEKEQNYKGRTEKDEVNLQDDIDDLREWLDKHNAKIEKILSQIEEEELMIRQPINNSQQEEKSESMFVPLSKEITVCGDIKLLSVLSPKRAGISKVIVFLGLKKNSQLVIVKIAEAHTLQKESELYDVMKQIANETNTVTKKLFQCDLEENKHYKMSSIPFLRDNYPILSTWENKDLQTLVIEQAKGEPMAIVFGDIHAQKDNDRERFEFDMSVWIQMAHLLTIFERHNFAHDDLHFNNIFVETLDAPKMMDFETSSATFMTKYVIKVIDFDRSGKIDAVDYNRDWLRFLQQYKGYETYFSVPYVENVDKHWIEMKRLIGLYPDVKRSDILSPQRFLESKFVQDFINNKLN